MALPNPIAATQTDAKSPIDQQLMDSIRLNLDYLEGQLGGDGAGAVAAFKANGNLWQLRPLLSLGHGKKIDGSIIPEATLYSRARLYQKKGGLSGTTEVDVLRNISLNYPILSITSQYTGATQSIGRLGSSLSTQSVALATPVINTQQIVYAKAAVNIESIVPITDAEGNSRWLITFSGGTLLDGDYSQGDSIVISGATNAANDGTFVIDNLNLDGLPSVVINNGSGVLQESAAGTGQLQLFEYTFPASVDNDFVVGEEVIFAGHTSGNNNGTYPIHATNVGGNNILVKNANGVTQGGVAGTATCTRWIYAFSSAPDATHYAVGEKALFQSHTSGNNNGSFIIRKVNDAGNNLYVTNNNGVVQAGAGGTTDTLRWLYAMPTDPTTDNDIQVGDTVIMEGHTSSNNDGTFVVTFVNRNAVNNVEIYNENGVAQGGTTGNVDTALRIIEFDTDYSADFVADRSQVLLEGLSSTTDDLTFEFLVKEVNRGVAQTNIVVFAEGLSEQGGKAGRVAVEARSIFTSRPKIVVAEANRVRNYEVDTTATFENEVVPADALVTIDIISIQQGLPEGLTLEIS